MNFHGIRWYPAQWQAGLGTVLALVVAFNFLTRVQADYVATIGVAAIGLVSAFLAKPWDIPLIGGLVTTALTAIGGFGWHLPDEKIAALVAALTWALGIVTHTLATPRAGSPYAADPGLAALGKAGPPKVTP